MLKLKQMNPLSSVASNNQVISDELFDFSLNASRVCTNAEQFDSYAETHAKWGMPYGLPNVSADEFKLLEYWLKAGALLAEPPALDSAYQQQIHIWETFLNGETLKQRQLFARQETRRSKNLRKQKNFHLFRQPLSHVNA